MLMVRDQTELNTPSFVSYTNFSKHLAFFFTAPPPPPPPPPPQSTSEQDQES